MAAFDAGAFRLAPGEAALMDPHGRLLLEHAAEALADAGGRQPSGPAAWRPGGSSTGVFVGCMWAHGECRWVLKRRRTHCTRA